MGTIPQEHVSKGPPVLVLAVGLEDDIFPKGNVRRNAFALHLLGESMQDVTHTAAVITTRGSNCLGCQAH